MDDPYPGGGTTSVVLFLTLPCVVLVVAIALGLGALARRADRLDERHASSRARARWVAARRSGHRRRRAAAVVGLRSFHRSESAVDQRGDGLRAEQQPPEH